MKTTKTVELFNIFISSLSQIDFLDSVRKILLAKGRLLAGYANIYALNLAWERSSFGDALNQFDVVFCDGFGIKLGAALTGQHIPMRYTPPDFIHPLMQIVREQNGAVFLLGAVPGVAERAAHTLMQMTPGLQISGVQHGYFDKARDSAENQAVVAKINSAQVALLLVAFGMPQQEEWLAQNWMHLNVNVALTVGALFDTMAGEVPRAPRWVTDHGFEWLARLIVEPRRLWRRYIIGIPVFFWRVVGYHWFGLTIP